MTRFKVADKAAAGKALVVIKEMNTIKEKLAILHWHNRKVPWRQPLLVKAPSMENASSCERRVPELRVLPWGLPAWKPLSGEMFANSAVKGHWAAQALAGEGGGRIKMSSQDDSRTWQCLPHYWLCRLERFKSKGFEEEEDCYIGFCQDWRAANARQCVEKLASL